MARLWTEIGREWGVAPSAASFGYPDFYMDAIRCTLDTGVFRSGTRSIKATANGAGAYLTRKTNTTSDVVFFRGYFRLPALPGAARSLWIHSYEYFDSYLGTVAQAVAEVRVSTAGVLSLWVHNGSVWNQAADLGTANVAANTWYRIEIKSDPVASTFDLRLDGVAVSTGTTWWSAPDSNAYFHAGIMAIEGQPAGSVTSGEAVFLSDLALNTETGASQNSWPGDGKVILLRPISDNARSAGMLAGGGATTNLWDALNNVPPVGVALGSATNTSQIKDAANNATDNYDANLQTYTTGGLVAGDTVTLVQAIGVIGNSTANNRNVAIRAVSNPADAAETNIGTGGTAVATYPTNWVGYGRGALVYAPTPTFGTSPVVRFGKRTASTDSAMCCALGLLVEYAPAGGGGPILTGSSRTTATATATDSTSKGISRSGLTAAVADLRDAGIKGGTLATRVLEQLSAGTLGSKSGVMIAATRAGDEAIANAIKAAAGAVAVETFGLSSGAGAEGAAGSASTGALAVGSLGAGVGAHTGLAATSASVSAANSVFPFDSSVPRLRWDVADQTILVVDSE